MSTTEVTYDVPPDPAALIESMRAFGYSLPTAIADLIDNSISARASEIDIQIEWAGNASTIAIIDDGVGMDEPTLMEAMRLGSRSPAEQRAPDDLGRFGLGLKSAAWSQARTLTVISRAGWSPPELRRWDLDHVTQTKGWSLLASGTETGERLRQRLDSSASGTIVLLERLDRLVGNESAEDEAARDRFWARVEAVRTHLSMVFHRFLTGRNAITVRVNGHALEPWDPFLESHPATQPLPIEWLGEVQVAPFVLPHWSKFSDDPDAHGRAAGIRGWNAQQGFYVYRARRLLVAGDWLRLRRMQQEEHYKLARIRIDLDNSMDTAWQIDVRKATARVPGSLEGELHRIAQATRRRAAEVYRFRGKVVGSDRQRAINFVWERVTRRGTHVFHINRRHPVLVALHERHPEAAGAVERALRLAEENLPVEAIVMDAREHPDEQRGAPHAGEAKEVLAMLREAHKAMIAHGADPDTALRALASVEPFDSHPEQIEILREERLA